MARKRRVVAPRSDTKSNSSLRIDRELLHQARVAALIDRKTLAQWFEEAVKQKLRREQASDRRRAQLGDGRPEGEKALPTSPKPYREPSSGSGNQQL